MKVGIFTTLMITAVGTGTSASANPFEKFFQPNFARKVQDNNAPTGPRIIVTNDIEGDTRRMLEDGFEVIGTSNFTGPAQDSKKSLKQALKIKADVVLYSSSFESTRSGAIPFLMPNSSTTTINGNIFGSNGWGGFGGSATTQTNTPMVIPFSVDRFNHSVRYFRKIPQEKIGIGIFFSPLNVEKAKILGTNKAVIVDYVIKNSPAFDANFFPEDIILNIAGKDFYNIEMLESIIEEFSSQTVPVEIIRNDKRMTLQIPIPKITPNLDVFSGDIILKVAGYNILNNDMLFEVRSIFAGQIVSMEILRDGWPMTLETSIPSDPSIKWP